MPLLQNILNKSFRKSFLRIESACVVWFVLHLIFQATIVFRKLSSSTSRHRQHLALKEIGLRRDKVICNLNFFAYMYHILLFLFTPCFSLAISYFYPNTTINHEDTYLNLDSTVYIPKWYTYSARFCFAVFIFSFPKCVSGQMNILGGSTKMPFRMANTLQLQN